MKKIYPFTTTEIPALEEVGGKALSLIKMTREGMPVPPGFVLAVNFFEQWFKTLQNTPEWELVQKSSLDKLGQATQALQSLCLELQLDHDQQKELNIALETVQASKNLNLFAIRSSSPEEDLEGASFAGIYETTLGVTAEVIETALRHSFASCFDERVFIYKKERGFPMNQPRIAVIVQQQIDADSAGVVCTSPADNSC